MTTVHRFFVAPSEMVGDRFPVPESIRHQVGRVLRLRDGARIVLLGGDGAEALCRLEGDRCIVEQRRPVLGEPRYRLTLVQAVLKGDGLDEVIDRGTELGIAAFRLVVTDRSVAREVTARRLDRLRLIAAEAAARSERGIVPPVDIAPALDEVTGPGSALLYERDAASSLRDSTVMPTRLIVGPEGGFAPSEVARATAAGSTIVSLGPRILRARSAGVAAATLLLAAAGDLG